MSRSPPLPDASVIAGGKVSWNRKVTAQELEEPQFHAWLVSCSALPAAHDCCAQLKAQFCVASDATQPVLPAGGDQFSCAAEYALNLASV